MPRKLTAILLISLAFGCRPSSGDSGLQPVDAAVGVIENGDAASSSTNTSDAGTDAATSSTNPDAATDAATSSANPDAATDAAIGNPNPDAATDAATSSANPDAGSTNPDAGSNTPTCVGTNRLDAWVSDPKLCVYAFATGIPRARGIAFAPNGDLFVNADGKLIALWDANGDGTSDTNERSTFATHAGLNHGLAFSRDNAFIYASSPATVYRWSYSPGSRQASASPEVVIDGIPTGGHATRTLAFDSQGRLIVSIGSASNVDVTQAEWNTRAQVRRYAITNIPSGGLRYESGEVIASGMRNEVGLFVDADDRVWGVENGRDDLADPDFGGDIHADNPGEELNLIDAAEPRFYGYPLCYSELQLPTGKGPGTQWADQTLDPSIQKTDDYCQNPMLVRPPVYVMPAHWAPLGIIRYRGHALPMTSDLIITAHGSWNRQPATGRVIARATLDGDTVTRFEPIVGEKNASGGLAQGTWNVRPVDVKEGPDSAIYVSDDQSGQILKIGYAQ